MIAQRSAPLRPRSIARQRRGPQIFSIPLHRAFADSLVAGIMAQHGGGPTDLARGMVLVPSNRARQAIQAAFVRAGGSGLLLPRLVAIGDPALDDGVGLALEAAAEAGSGTDPGRPMVDPLHRRAVLARLIRADHDRRDEPIGDAAAYRLADALARTLDQLQYEEKGAGDLVDLSLAEGLAGHWQTSLRHLGQLATAWPAALEAMGADDLAVRRNALYDAVASAWAALPADKPPAAFVIAAGVTVTAPAIARLLRVVADLETGAVVLPGLDLMMPDAQWEALGPVAPPADPDAPQPPRLETHPQYALKLLLERMGVARDEVMQWPASSAADGPPGRDALIGALFAPPAFTHQWQAMSPRDRALPGVSMLEFPDSAREAQGIALMLRETLETPGRTAALVTPDRILATRVAAQLGRWDIAVDDSAGRALDDLPPGVLAVTLAEAATEGFTPPRVISLLGHPLVAAGEGRQGWLRRVHELDHLMRTPGIAPGLDGIRAFLVDTAGGEPAAEPDIGDAAPHEEEERTARRLSTAQRRARDLLPWWDAVAGRLRPIAALFAAPTVDPVAALEALNATLDDLAGPAVWAEPAGRALADVLDRLALGSGDGIAPMKTEDVPAFVHDVLSGVSVRPPWGGHPRLFIWGLIEARLQRCDRMVLGALNEGHWPAAPAPDPWLAPGIRRALGLPSLDRATGLAALDFASGLAAGDVIVTRAARDGSDPAVASRLWLRLQAVTGGVPRDPAHADYVALAEAMDAPAAPPPPMARPAPCPPVARRPRGISVTRVDELARDPFHYYARAILGLDALGPVSPAASPAWRGSRVHEILEHWVRDDGAALDALEPRLTDLRDDPANDALARALWLPRIEPAIRWAADTIVAQRAAGRKTLVVEAWGELAVGGVTLRGKADRIDRLDDGTLAVVDYKTGGTPDPADVREGRARQLGLLGLMAAEGAIDGLAAPLKRKADAYAAFGAFEYWRLVPNKKRGEGGAIVSAFSKRYALNAQNFVATSREDFIALVDTYLLKATPFAPGTGADAARIDTMHQLMRREEWFGREPAGAAEARA